KKWAPESSSNAARVRLKRKCRQRWQLHQNGVIATHPWAIFALDPPEVPDVAAAVGFRIGVYDFAIESDARNAETVIGTHNGRRVHDEDDHFAFARFPNERHDTIVRVVKIDPLKALIRIVLLPERGLAFVSIIQMLHQPAQSIVFRKIEKVPIEARVVVPFAPLAEFTAHEEQFFAR